MTFQTKDSGERASFASGMVRDSEKGKPRFDLLLPQDMPFGEQMMTRDAMLMARGAEKYEARNWEKARGQAELDRYRSSALRHLMQWIAGETDEDHAAAVRFNIMAGEYVKWRMAQDGPQALVAETARRMVESFTINTCPWCGLLAGEAHALTCPSWPAASPARKFLCGHVPGDEPAVGPGLTCGTAIHWSRSEGLYA